MLPNCDTLQLEACN